MTKMTGVFLDTATVGPNDISLDDLNNLPVEWTFYDSTTPNDVAERIAEAQIVLTNKVVLGSDVITAAPKLEYIGVTATGFNIIDLEAAKAKNVTVTNVAGYSTASVVQIVFAMILSLSTPLNTYDQKVKAGDWQASPLFTILDPPYNELAGKTLGILGGGTIGRGVADVAHAFGMEVVIAERKGASTIRAGRTPFEKVLQQADIVSLHCPLTPETTNMIGLDELNSMKETALVINAARGGVVDEAALATALKEGEIAGAGVDVLTQEPPKDGNPLLDGNIPNLVIAPHIAWASIQARQRLIDGVADNIDAWLSATPKNVII